MDKRTFLKLELKNFLGDKAVVAAILFIFATGFYAIYHGKNVIYKQKALIAQLPTFQAEHFKKQVELSKDDFGNMLYYLKHDTSNEPSSWAAFSIGQRDVNPFNVKVTMLTLEGQLYDSELTNPKNLLYGNLDLAFVIVFLFPLVIIAFCHNLISAEQENGVWNLLRSQPASVTKIIGWRFLIRFATVFVIALVLIVSACFLLHSPFDIRFAYALLLTISYLGFWFGLAAFVVSLQRSSTVSALSLLGVWIFLTILAPALLNLAVSTALPVSESYEMTIAQREGYHQKWDKAKAVTMQKFYEIYPEYASVPIPEDKFTWGWYYAAQFMGDLESAASTESYFDKLRKRDEWTSKVSLVLPTVNTQLAFNRLSKNDLQSHLEYLGSIKSFHTQVREFYYPYIFSNAKTDAVDWQNLPKHTFASEQQPAQFPQAIWAIAALAVLFGGMAWRKLIEI